MPGSEQTVPFSSPLGFPLSILTVAWEGRRFCVDTQDFQAVCPHQLPMQAAHRLERLGRQQGGAGSLQQGLVIVESVTWAFRLQNSCRLCESAGPYL